LKASTTTFSVAVFVFGGAYARQAVLEERSDEAGYWVPGGGRSGRNAQDFQAEINAWLEQHPGITVVGIKQSASGGSFADSLWLISVWYEETANPATAPDRGSIT
jgi:hypothetical protein